MGQPRRQWLIVVRVLTESNPRRRSVPLAEYEASMATKEPHMSNGRTPETKLGTAVEVIDAVDRVAEAYESNALARASMHLLPHIGPAIDALLAGRGSTIYKERIDSFLAELSTRLGRVEASPSLDFQSPAFLDLIRDAFEGVARARSELKRSLFARLIARKVAEGGEWEDSELAIRLLANLADVHVEILRVALNAPVCDGAFVGSRVVTLVPGGGRGRPANTPPLALAEALPRYPLHALRMGCAELVSWGLLHDEGIGRLETPALGFFVATELAIWFQQRLEDSGNVARQSGDGTVA